MMKRRNAEIGKMRRPMKRGNKIAEGIYGSTVLYLKFLLLWVLVILADFILEFRFEFLWPFYLLLRSVYDSFKYQGLAFSIFFVCIALTSDMLCFFFIPVHWLFFAASTYVWVQYVWHTDKGICAPTIILWILFVYLEAAVRLRDVKHMPGHLDLCRPFAAHCIGYPVVTLGFGFKSYVGYRIRQRKQRDVAKENEFYMQLMQQALPPIDGGPLQQQNTDTTVSSSSNNNSNAIVPAQQQLTTTVVQNNTKVHNSSSNNSSNSNNNNNNTNKQSLEKNNGYIPNGNVNNTNTVVQHNNTNHHHHNHHQSGGAGTKSHRKTVDKCKDHHNISNNVIIDEQHHNNNTKHHNNNNKINHSHTNGTIIVSQSSIQQHTHQICDDSSPELESNNTKQQQHHHQQQQQTAMRKREKKEQDSKEREANEYLQKLEADARKLRIDLQSSRSSEQELRLQVAALTTSEKVSKGELSSFQREIDDYQQRLQNVVSSRTSDKQTINNLERRIAEERRIRCNLESQLNQERKARKQDEARAAQQVAAAQSSRGECTDSCKARRRELENELSDCLTSKHWIEERFNAAERENAQLLDQLRDTDLLMTALTALQEKNTHLENSLSAETRIKLDLFSALGEAKRQLEIKESSNRHQEREIDELKSKIAQILAVMPNDTFGGSPATNTNSISRVRLAESPPGSTLDPNATAYTPKNSLVTSTEA